MTPDELRKLLLVTKALWLHFELSDSIIDVWFAILHDFDYHEAEEIVTTTAMRGERFAPSPAVIARKIVHRRSGYADPDVVWNQALDVVRGSGGRYGEPNWPNELLAAACQRFGGWQRLCNADVEWTGPQSDRARFEDIYRRLLEEREAELVRRPELLGDSSSRPELNR